MYRNPIEHFGDVLAREIRILDEQPTKLELLEDHVTTRILVSEDSTLSRVRQYNGRCSKGKCLPNPALEEYS